MNLHGIDGVQSFGIAVLVFVLDGSIEFLHKYLAKIVRSRYFIMPVNSSFLNQLLLAIIGVKIETKLRPSLQSSFLLDRIIKIIWGFEPKHFAFDQRNLIFWQTVDVGSGAFAVENIILLENRLFKFAYMLEKIFVKV